MLVISGSSSAWKLLEPGNARLEANSQDTCRGSPEHVLVQDNLFGGTTCVESMLPGSTFTAFLLWLFPSLQALHLPAFERSHAVVVSSSMDPPLKTGMSSPFLTGTNRAGAGFASEVSWQAAGEAESSTDRVLSSPSLSPGFGCGTLVRPWHFSTLG